MMKFIERTVKANPYMFQHLFILFVHDRTFHELEWTTILQNRGRVCINGGKALKVKKWKVINQPSA